jgi:hypothetical protein
MEFKKNKYAVLRKAIPEEIANFCYEYLMIKRKATEIMFKSNYLSPYSEYFGTFNDKQVPNTYSHYADFGMETLLLYVLPKIEKITKLKLIPNYSYMRIYKKEDILHRHKDRFSCEISATLNLGGDLWPIYLEPDSSKGKDTKNGYEPGNTKGKKIILKKCDMLIYKGSELEHWRESFNGEDCVQVFFHYTDEKTKGAIENKFDRRPFLGLPAYFKK